MEKDSSGIGRRFARISAVSGVSTALSVGLQLVSVPVCLHFWGNEIYGQWLALFAAFVLMRTVDSGYVSYVGNKLNILYHTDEGALRETMASAIWGVLALAILQLGLLAVLFMTDSVGILIHGSDDPTALANSFFALAVLVVTWILTGSYMGVIHRLLIPTGMMYQAAWWSMALQVGQFAGLMASAILGLSLLQAAFVFATLQAAVYLASAVYIRARLPRFYPWWHHPRAARGLSDLVNSAPFTASGVLQQGGASGVVVAVSAILGAAAVPAIATVRTVANMWTMLITVFSAPLLPELVRFDAQAAIDKLMATQRAHWFLMSVVVNLSILLAYPFIGTAYRIWTGHHLSLDHELLNLLLAALPLMAASALTNVYLTGVNRLRYVFFCASTRGAGVMGGSLILMPIVGAPGIGVAVFLAELIVLASSLWYFLPGQLRRSNRKLVFRRASWCWLSTAAVMTYLGAELFHAPNGIIIYISATTVSLVASVVAWIKLDHEVKLRILDSIGNMRK